MSTITEILRRIVGADSQAPAGPVQAIWNGTVIAESDRTVVVEGKDHIAFWHGVKVKPADHA